MKNSMLVQDNEDGIGRLRLLLFVGISFRMAFGLQSGLVPSGFRIKLC